MSRLFFKKSGAKSSSEVAKPVQAYTGPSRIAKLALKIVFIGLWSCMIGVLSLKLGSSVYGIELFQSYFRYLVILILNLLPGFIIALFALALSGRVWVSTLASGMCILLPATINYFKLEFRGEPLLFSDVAYAKEAAQISTGYNLHMTPTLAVCLTLLIAIPVFSALFEKKHKTMCLFRFPLRLCAALAVVAVAVGLYIGPYTSERVYNFTSNLRLTFENGYEMNEWNEKDLYCCRGFAYPLIRSISESSDPKPDNYDKREAESILAAQQSYDIPEDKKVNILAIMLEAYADFSEIPEFPELTTDVYAFWHELENESISGSLLTNIFAGGTIDSERCFLTGSTDLYNYRVSGASYARYFSEQGYYTEFSHAGYAWFYNRQNVCEYLGFDKSYFFEDTYKAINGSFPWDIYYFPCLLENLQKQSATGTPYFEFAVTYQNHGPYSDEILYDEETEYVSRGNLTEEAYNILNNYLWGINITDEALRELVGSLREEEEPVVLVLFGDHKPWLGDDSTVYAELGIDLSRGSTQSLYNYYETPYVIWANDAAKETLGNDFIDDGGMISPCYLMMKLFDACGWQGDGYMQLLREAYAESDTINALGLYRSDDGTFTTQCPEAVEKLREVSYYRRTNP